MGGAGGFSLEKEVGEDLSWCHLSERAAREHMVGREAESSLLTQTFPYVC